jgi:hypothetical protein
VNDDDLTGEEPPQEARQSFQIQAKLVEIGAAMHFAVWVPKPDRAWTFGSISSLLTKDKVFHEMRRPVFALLQAGPLSDRCAFISYDNVNALHGLEHLSYVNQNILKEYEDEVENVE